MYMDNKKFIDRLSEILDIDKSETDKLANDLCEIIVEKVAEGDSVVIPSFGNFEPRKKMERIVVHPSSGKKLLVPPRLTISFRASGNLKAKVKYEGNNQDKTD